MAAAAPRRWALRSRRVVTPGRRRAGHRGDRGRADRGGDRRRARGERRRRRRYAGRGPRRSRAGPGPRRLPRPRQRAGAHRVGGLRDGDARRRGGGRDDAGRHAAQLPAGDHHAPAALEEKLRACGGRAASSTSGSGAASCRATPPSCRASPRAACSAARRSSCTRGSTSSRTRPRPTCGRRCPSCARTACRCSRTRSWTWASDEDPGQTPRTTPARAATNATCESRPAAWEDAAIALLIRLCRETGCAVHIVHLSSAEALPDVARARAEGLPSRSRPARTTCAWRPRRSPTGRPTSSARRRSATRDNREALWRGLAEGVDRLRGHRPQPLHARAEGP